jgi:hypothetical protein
MTTPLSIGRRVCKDCRTAIVPPSVYRCADCLIRRIDKIRKEFRK